MTLPPSSQIRLQRSSTQGQRPTTTAAADHGEVAVNIPDRKLFMRNTAGVAVTVADRIIDFSATRPYEAGDITIYASALWQAKAAIPAGAWNPALWTALGATGANDPILKVPAGDATNTIQLTGNPSRKGLVIDGDPAQTGNLLEIPGTAANDGRSAIIDALGFPNERLGPSIFRVVQATHGFAFIGQPIAFTGGRWVKAQANAVATRCIAVVEQVLDANTFVLRTGDRITQLQVNAFAGGVIAPETIYYVSDTVAGQLTTVASVTRPDPVLYTISTSVALVMIGYAGGAGYVQKTGDTMTGNLTLSGVNRVSFDTGAAALFKGAGTPSIFAHVGGVLSARIDEDDNVAAYNQTLVTRLKGDARYLKVADKNSILLELFNIMYPVGSIYASVTNSAPDWGTWVAWGQGRAMVGVGTADGTSWAVNEAKGASNVALTTAMLPSHTHAVDVPSQSVTSSGHSADHTHAVSQSGHSHGVSDPGHNHYVNDPGHAHSYIDTTGQGPGGAATGLRYDAGPFYLHELSRGTNGSGTGIWLNASGTGIGIAAANANISIGGTSANHTHTVTINPASFASGAAGSGAVHSNIQPSIGVYLFRRTA